MIMCHPGDPGDPETDQETRHFNGVKFNIHKIGFEKVKIDRILLQETKIG